MIQMVRRVQGLPAHVASVTLPCAEGFVRLMLADDQKEPGKILGVERTTLIIYHLGAVVHFNGGADEIEALHTKLEQG